MSLLKTTALKAALIAGAAAAALMVLPHRGISQTTGSIIPAAPQELEVLDSFSDKIYERRVAYFETVKDTIPFVAANYGADLVAKHSETFADFAEATPRRTAWMMPTDSGWVSAGGADLFEVHMALKRTARVEKDGKVKYGPLTITPDLMTDLKDRTKRVEVRFGNKLLSFKTPENRDRYAELVKSGEILELQDMQCAMAPVHPKRPHLAGATLMVVVAEEMKGINGKPLFVQTYNSAHVAASYDMDSCATISNAAFRDLSSAGKTFEGAKDLVKKKRLDDMRVPAFTPINPIQNIKCAPLS